MAIETDYDNMLRQAPMAAHDLLNSSIYELDKILGQGEALKNPELLIAVFKTASREFNNGVLAVAIQEASQRLAGAIELAAARLASD